MNGQLGFRVVVSILVLFLVGCTDSSTRKTKTKSVTQKENTQENTERQNPQRLACAVETCGIAAQVPFYTAPAKEIDVRLFKQRINAPLMQYIDLEINSIDLKNKILFGFSDVRVDKISDNYLVLINFSYFSDFSKEISSSLRSVGGHIKISTMKLRQELYMKGLANNSRLVDWIILAAQAFYESEIFRDNIKLSQYPFEIFVKKNYPDIDLLTAIATEAQKLLDIQNRLVEVYPILKSRSAKTKLILQKAISKTPLDPDEKEDFVSSRLSYLFFQELLPGGKFRASMLQRPTSIAAIASGLLQKIKTSRRVRIDANNFEKSKQEIVFKCTYNLLNKIASSPTPEQNLAFSDLVQNLKSHAKTVVTSARFNGSHLLNTIDQVKIILPPTKEQTLAGLERSLHNEFNNLNETLKLLSKLDLQDPQDKEIILLMLATQYNDVEESENPLEGVTEFCQDNQPEFISDASYSSYSIVNIGWRSVLYPQYGYGIAAHELGHVVSDADESQTLNAFAHVKSCLKQNQYGSAKFVEEDFADLFATEMIKSNPLSPNKGNGNFSCLLLNQGDGNFIDLVMSAELGDTHSSGLYRLIAIGTQLNSLTPACQAVKQSSPLGQRMRNCWGL